MEHPKNIVELKQATPRVVKKRKRLGKLRPDFREDGFMSCDSQTIMMDIEKDDQNGVVIMRNTEAKEEKGMD